jgi:UMF1 family MFS transporter
VTSATPPPPSRAERSAWCLYDFANSSFTTVVVTFVFAVYFTKAMAPDEVVGTSRWSWGVALSAVLIALLSPVLGAVADATRAKKTFVLLFSALCIVTTAGLALVSPGNWILALLLFVVANVAFEMGIVFYNAFLPELAPKGAIGRLSGYAWGLGYLGGLLCLVLALFLVQGVPWPGPEGWTNRQLVPAEGQWNVRATNLLVALWFLVFSLPFFALVRERSAARPLGEGNPLRAGLAQLAETLGRLRHFRQAGLFLLARLVYNDGLVAIFAFGAIYAGASFGMSQTRILVFGIWLNVAAGLGAWLFGRMDDRVGAKATLVVSLLGLILANVIGILAPSLPRPVLWLYVSGTLIGLMAGPNQSASRSLMGRFVPERHSAEFFGFYAFSGKCTSFVGPMALGLVTGLTGDPRWGVATLLPLFAVGLLLLLLVDEKEGIRAARELDGAGRPAPGR